MKLITENRFEMAEALKEINPTKIMTFSTFNLDGFKNKKIQVLINTKFRNTQPKDNQWWIRCNNKIHSKIAIGTKGFIIGSWNFSDNSTFNMHESILKIMYEEDPEFQKQLVDYFDKLWGRSSEIK